MRIFKRKDKPAAGSESAPVLGDSLFDRLLRRQLSRKHIVRDPLTGKLIDLSERYDPSEVRFR
jgi:hypothetical protein